jgi:MoaA/NifB/PqqE/SkfB family radical SAM enzyme
MSSATRQQENCHPADTARIPLLQLDWVWFYLPGTLCNLECAHCLVNGSPRSRTLIPLKLEELERALQEVAEYQNGYPFRCGFTGGEVFMLKPFKHGRRLFPMAATALKYGDLLILTNGLLADHETLAALQNIERSSPHAISYRISLDGATAEENDSLRHGAKNMPTFDLILASVRRFLEHGIRPTIAYTYEGTGKAAAVLQRKKTLESRYQEMLCKHGLEPLELWGIPFFDQGFETRRRERLGIPHLESPGITNHCIATYAGSDFQRFQCAYSRSFGKEANGECGWYKCAVLPAKEIALGAYLGSSLQEAVREISIEHPQCITCFHAATQGAGMSCSG